MRKGQIWSDPGGKGWRVLFVTTGLAYLKEIKQSNPNLGWIFACIGKSNTIDFPSWRLIEDAPLAQEDSISAR